MSSDGRFVLFNATGFGGLPEDLYVRDRVTGETRSITATGDGSDEHVFGQLDIGPSLTDDGRSIVYYSEGTGALPGGMNLVRQIVLSDLQAGLLSVVSKNEQGEAGDWDSNRPSISPNGRYVAYHSGASNLVSTEVNRELSVFVFDRQTGVTRRASVAFDGSEPNGPSGNAVVSDSGLVVFDSEASNLVEDDTNGVNDVFVRDVENGITRRVSVATDGTEATGMSFWPSISGDGSTVAFTSASDNLVPEDNNGSVDVHAYDVESGNIKLLSANDRGTPGNSGSLARPGALSYDGSWCVFQSVATDFVRRDRNGAVADVFVVRVK